MKSDVKGVSTCPVGVESYETYIYRNKTYYQYDYRNTDGELFSCVAPTLEKARQRKDVWLKTKEG